MTALAMILCLGLSGVCEAAPSRSPAPVAAAPAFVRAARAAGAVFEARVVDVGPPPGFWSGFAVAFQSVTYRITKIYGDRDHRLRVGKQVTVQHWIVAESDTADSEPRLRPDLVHVGATMIVLADWNAREQQWTGVDEHYGVVAADAAHRAALGHH